MESPALSEFDLHLFAEGRHWHIYNVLGAHLGNQRGIEGARFAVWAPNAQAVSVIGDFNDWDSGRHPMAVNKDYGVWSVFIGGGVKPGDLYKLPSQPETATTSPKPIPMVRPLSTVLPMPQW